MELEIDPSVRLAPDEQIEIFRIVQEGLANARTHAGARRVEVTIGHRGGRRVVIVSDDGVGFEHDDDSGVGQGLRNMRARRFDRRRLLAALEARDGTAIEVVLRPV